MKRDRRSRKTQPESRFQRLLNKPWLFAGAAFGLDLAMLVTGIVLSRMTFEPDYTVTDNIVSRSEPLAFFGVTAAVVLGMICVLTAFIIAGAVRKKRGSVQLAGAVGLLLVSLAMVGSSAYMTMGFPPERVNSYSYSDESYQLIIEESRYSSGKNSVSLYLAKQGEGDDRPALRLATTELKELSTEAERYTVNWVSGDDLMIGFEDAGNYRTLQIKADKSRLDSME